ncbi:hypothetical protein ScPMuIL_017987 [Solemya velum]
MSSHILKRTNHPHDFLERILNKTTLTTQRVGHSKIIDLGGLLMTTKADDSKEQRERELQEALDAAEARATRELRIAVKRCCKEKDEEKRYSLEQQQGYYERLAKRIETQRDKAEEERRRELTKILEGQHREALDRQLEESEREKERAVSEACAALTEELEARFLREKEAAIEAALDDAWEKYRKSEQDAINRTRRECQVLAKQEAEKVKEIHRRELARQDAKYQSLENKYQEEVNEKQRLLKDFRALQSDYQRFLDYSDGRYHSDYLMHLRHTGRHWADKRKSEEATFEDIFDL